MGSVEALYATMRDRLAAMDVPSRFLDPVPNEPGPLRPVAPRRAPGADTLAALAAQPGADAVLRTAAGLSDRLAWRQSYTEAEIGRSYLAGQGYVEMLGRRGHFGEAGAAFGLGVVGSGAAYGDHRHPAEEVYAVLAGAGRFRRAGEDWQTAGPGDLVTMPGGVWHALETRAEPLVYLYVWLGGDPSVRSEIRGLDA